MAEEQEARFRADAAAEVHTVERDAKDMRSDRITAKLLDMVDHLQRDVLDHMRKEGETVRELKDGLARVEKRVEDFVQAFPAGDAIQHRLAHEAQIEAAREKKEFWAKIKFTLTALVLTAIIGWAAFALWAAFLLGPK